MSIGWSVIVDVTPILDPPGDNKLAPAVLSDPTRATDKDTMLLDTTTGSSPLTAPRMMEPDIDLTMPLMCSDACFASS
jgi:hypothetical protein